MTKQDITRRYGELFDRALRLETDALAEWNSGLMEEWHQWATSALQLLSLSFGKNSIPFQNLKKAVDSEERMGPEQAAVTARGVFLAAKEDYEAGFATTLERRISGEILGDLLSLGRAAFNDGYKDSAAVLASAAFEDSLKKIGTLNGLDLAERELQEVVNALKAKQILTGGAGRLADQYVKTRNWALHANWEKVTAEEVGGLIGFVESLLVKHLS